MGALEQIPNWLYEPFGTFALDTVGIWYLGTLAVMFVVGVILKYGLGFEAESPIPDDWSLGQKLFAAAVSAPMIEEMLFRIAPMWLGLSTTAVIGLSVLWALMHGKRWLLVSVTVPIYVKLALASMFVELILVHAFHNMWVTLLNHFWPDEEDDVDTLVEADADA